jgi:hypothetical protein
MGGLALEIGWGVGWGVSAPGAKGLATPSFLRVKMKVVREVEAADRSLGVGFLASHSVFR